MAAGENAFTLLELLVALVLFALLSLLAYGSLRTMLDHGKKIEEEETRLAALQMTMARLAQDLRQVQGRGIRDEYGANRPAMHYAGAGNSGGLELTRADGHRSTPALPHSNLQRLRYHWEDHKLIREIWPVLDRGPGVHPFRQTMLGRVNGFEVRFLAAGGVWFNHWPPGTSAGAQIGGGDSPPDPRLPQAMEIRLDLDDWGQIRRLFPLRPGSILK